MHTYAATVLHMDMGAQHGFVALSGCTRHHFACIRPLHQRHFCQLQATNQPATSHPTAGLMGADPWSSFIPAPHIKVAATVGALARVPLHMATLQQPLLGGRAAGDDAGPPLLTRLQSLHWGQLGVKRVRSSALRAFASSGISCQVSALLGCGGFTRPAARPSGLCLPGCVPARGAWQAEQAIGTTLACQQSTCG